MADELLLRRLRIGWHDDDTPIWVSDAMTEAAARIEQLTAERDGLLRCVTDNHVALCRAEAAEAERDRLREALALADAALSGANMNMAVVQKKVKFALANTATEETNERA